MSATAASVRHRFTANAAGTCGIDAVIPVDDPAPVFGTPFTDQNPGYIGSPSNEYILWSTSTADTVSVNQRELAFIFMSIISGEDEDFSSSGCLVSVTLSADSVTIKKWGQDDENDRWFMTITKDEGRDLTFLYKILEWAMTTNPYYHNGHRFWNLLCTVWCEKWGLDYKQTATPDMIYPDVMKLFYFMGFGKIHPGGFPAVEYGGWYTVKKHRLRCLVEWLVDNLPNMKDIKTFPDHQFKVTEKWKQLMADKNSQTPEGGSSNNTNNSD
jgi:hypothetical protein